MKKNFVSELSELLLKYEIDGFHMTIHGKDGTTAVIKSKDENILAEMAEYVEKYGL